MRAVVKANGGRVTTTDAGRAARALRTAEEYVDAHFVAPNGVIFDPHPKREGANGYAFHVRHHYAGIPIFLTASVVHVDDRSVRIAGSGTGAQLGSIELDPSLSAKQALKLAVHHLKGKDARNEICDGKHSVISARARPRFVPLGTFPSPTRSTVFSKGPFLEPVTVELTILDVLAWLIAVTTVDRSEYVIVLAAAGNGAGTVLFCRDVSARACAGAVFLFDPRHAASQIELPCTLDYYPHGPLPAASIPSRWMHADATVGDNVETFWNSKKVRVKATASGSGMRFRAPSVPPNGDDCLVNAFFFCNLMHDFFALLGFSDEEGAFHAVNTTSQGKAGDALLLFLTSNEIQGLGRMRASKDGVAPELVLGKGTRGHAALEGTVVIHEYVHGVTQRLIGGRLGPHSLFKRQALALGEAWSDFFCITIQNYYRRVQQPPLAEEYAFAGWCMDASVRVHSYDNHPGTFGQAGKGAYSVPHHAGEIWAAAAIDFARDLVWRFGLREGYSLAWRLMYASLRTIVANPTFLDARDELFTVIAADTGDPSVLVAAREAFARKGMGDRARAPDADRYDGNVEDFSTD